MTGAPDGCAEITVDSVRAATAALRVTAAAGGCRVAVIDGAETLNRNAANALLKTLEEPPKQAFLIWSAIALPLFPQPSGRAAPSFGCSPCRTMWSLTRWPGWSRSWDEQRHALAAGARQHRTRARDRRGRAARLLPAACRGAGHKADRSPGPGRAVERAGARRGSQRGRGNPDAAPGVAGARDRSGRGPARLPLFPEETSVLAKLAAGRPLDRWAALWEKVARLAAAVEALNLERSQALMQMLTLLAPDADHADRPRRRRTRSLPCPRLTRSTSRRRSTTSTTRRTSVTRTPRWRATRSHASRALRAGASVSSPVPTSTARRWRRPQPPPARRRRPSPTRYRSGFVISPGVCRSPTTTSSARPRRVTASGCRHSGASSPRAARSISAPMPAGIRCATSRSMPRTSWSMAGRRPAPRGVGRGAELFLRLSAWQQPLLDFYDAHPDFILPLPGATRW